MIRSDFHMHTVFCDGKNTAEEMVLAAIQKGMSHIGFSAHSKRSFLGGHERLPVYREEILRLREAYRDRIQIYCGLEVDTELMVDPKDYHYLIGSVHTLQKDGDWMSIMNPKHWEIAIAKLYGGDGMAVVEDYYAAVASLSKYPIDVIGHLDICTRSNAGGRFFDEQNPRYLRAACEAVDALIPLDIPFEVNTGVISRGYWPVPNPHPEILRYIASQGGRAILNSDAHAAEHIGFGFNEWEDRIRAMIPILDDWRPDRG